MNEIETMRVRQKPLEMEAVRFPKGGKTQHYVSQWVESLNWEMPLWDGNVKMLDHPADDGSMWRWVYGIIRDPNDRTDSQHVFLGDYIIHRGDGSLVVVKPWEFDRLYEEVSDDA